MKKIKVYIAGPISGMPDLNKPEFADMADKLRKAGFDAVNPHETCEGIEGWVECMKADIKQLMDCDYIILLDGWNNSRGCRIEIALCRELGIKELKNATESALRQDM